MSLTVSELPEDLTFFQEWRRILFTPNGDRVENVDSNWYRDENVILGLLNPEYPEPSSTGWYMRIQTRWVSEYRTVAHKESHDRV